MTRRAFMHTAALGLTAMALPGCVTTDPQASPGAVIFMHGKTALPYSPSGPFLAGLAGAGFAVSGPEMPWSRNRYISGSLPAAFDQIGADIESFRKAGYRKVLIGGISMGAAVAVGYAAVRGPVDGLVLMAPGHAPLDFAGFATGESLRTARDMVAAGRGTERATFADSNIGQRLSVTMAAADYLTWFDPQGDAEMRVTAPRIAPNVPVFLAVGARDSLRVLGRQVFDALPPSSQKQFVTVNSDHGRVPETALGPVTKWLTETFPAPKAAKLT